MLHCRVAANRLPCLWLLCVLMFGLLLPNAVQAKPQKQAKPKQKTLVGSPRQMAVDVVLTNDGQRFHGVLTKNNDDFAVLAVERSWLQQRMPKFYKTHLAAEVAEEQRKNEQLVERIEEWLTEKADEPNLVFFLEDERDAAKAKLANQDLSSLRFTLVRIERSNIRRTYQQTNEQRRIALAAWSENLNDVSDRSADKLRRELKAKKIDYMGIDVDFRDDVVSPAESNRSWAIRKAMVEYEVLERTDYQGVDGTFFEAGADNNQAGILRVMMGSGGKSQLQQIGEMLDLPEFTRNKKSKKDRDNDDWWQKTAAEAAKKGARCFSITRMDNDIMSDDVNIEVALIAKDDNDKWTRVGTFLGTAKGSEQDEADIATLKEDPRVKQALEMVGQMGVLDQKTVKKAMLRGLATQSAMQDAKSKFGKFLFQHTDRLDGTEIRLRK